MTNNQFPWITHYIPDPKPCKYSNNTESEFLPGIAEICTHELRTKYHHLDFQIVIALDVDTAYALLQNMAERVQAGRRFKEGEIIEDLIQNGPVRLQTVLDSNGKLVFRIILPDENGYFPDDPLCNPLFALQACLSTKQLSTTGYIVTDLFGDGTLYCGHHAILLTAIDGDEDENDNQLMRFDVKKCINRNYMPGETIESRCLHAITRKDCEDEKVCDKILRRIWLEIYTAGDDALRHVCDELSGWSLKKFLEEQRYVQL